MLTQINNPWRPGYGTVPYGNSYGTFDSQGEVLDVVGSCPACGAPVYGRKSLRDDEVPIVVRGCTCVHGGRQPFPVHMEVK